jgi:hypothetical protein
VSSRVTGLSLVCLAGLSCQKSPAPQSWQSVVNDLPAPLFSVWESSDDVLYAAGGSFRQSLLIRHDKTGWWNMDPGTQHALWWVFGFSSSNVYAVGEAGLITHFDGQSWTVLQDGQSYTLYGVWGASPDDLWAVGGFASASDARPILLRGLSGAWSEWDAGLPAHSNLFKVWGSSANDVYFVGDDGLVAHFDGSAISTEATPSNDRLVTVFGTGPNDVYAVGGLLAPQFIHWNGQAWTSLVAPNATQSLNGGAATAGGGLVVIGEQGYVADGTPSALQVVPPLSSDCLHGAAPILEGSFAAVGGDILGAQVHGILIAKGSLQGGARQSWPYPGHGLDGGPAPADGGLSPDAGPTPDSGTTDGGSPDAGSADSGAPDSGGCPDPADSGCFPTYASCDNNYQGCVPPDTCWLVFYSHHFYCLPQCQTIADCPPVDGGACCQVPGPQATQPECLPQSLGVCDGGP